MQLKNVALSALLAQDASAQAVSQMFRFACSQLVTERADPLVNPGQNPSTHSHQIVGGNSFNITMDPKNMNPGDVSTCTSCTFAEDNSNYWTASLYFKSPENGTYKKVPQMANGGLTQNGGLTVYYMYPYTQEKTVQAFKPGFRMLTGDPSLRKGSQTNPNVCHRCNGNGEGFAPCDNKDTWGFPNKPCPGGIRASIIFPSCWDGKNLDSPDHKSHVAYSGTGTGGLGYGACPATHPIRVPQVMYEVMWDTRQFLDKSYYGTNKQPLVYSFGDATGFGQHGDYLFGWKGDALQKGMDALKGSGCYNNVCSALKTQTAAAAMACKKDQQVVEDVGVSGGWLKELPGGVAITY